MSPRGFSNAPFKADGATEIPLTCFYERPNRLRPLQLCAASTEELELVMTQMHDRGEPVVNILSHSFELLCRRRTHPNKMLLSRLDRYLDVIAAAKTSGDFHDLNIETMLQSPCHSAPVSGYLPTLKRTALQVYGHLVYDRMPYPQPVQPTL